MGNWLFSSGSPAPKTNTNNNISSSNNKSKATSKDNAILDLKRARDKIHMLQKKVSLHYSLNRLY